MKMRLHNLLIARQPFDKPGDVVRWLGAVQAQDYLGGLWAVGLRLPGATQADIERAIDERTIVRTWPMRGTIHFVAAEDIRWMLGLLAPRVMSRMAGRIQRDMGVDQPTLARSRGIITRALQGGKQLTRPAIYRLLEEGGVTAANQRGLHILGWLAHEGFICFAGRQGKQPTFALLDEWVPPSASKSLQHDEALAEIASRYFTSHGPATVQDFSWWTGLPAGEARRGIEMARAQLAHEVIEGRTYWLSPIAAVPQEPSRTAHLLPPYDEYTVAYKDRSPVLAPEHSREMMSIILNASIERDGRIGGTWKRTLGRDTVTISLQPFAPLSSAEYGALEDAASRYGNFLGLKPTMQETP